ncbi:MAG TPA: very short patch repair endonuclease [Candidatus Marinimicrobia bacterium]|nr:very short patch repair endonuclease [Candidatus Neomarinimicrobiota bacterium]
MTDNLNEADRKKTMKAVKSKNTFPERRLRASLAGNGINGWKLHNQEVPGKPDISFLGEKIAIFVDGCFWHGCPTCAKPLPKTNKEYWSRKIKRNCERDKELDLILHDEGWLILRVWTHEIRKMDSLRVITSRINCMVINRRST